MLAGELAADRWTTRLARGGYVSDRSMWRCPTHKNPFDWMTTQSQYENSPQVAFGMRSQNHMNYFENGVNMSLQPYVMPSPSEYPILTDSVQFAYTSTFPQVYRLDGYAAGVHVRHNGAANVTFGDGHVVQMGAEAIRNSNSPYFNHNFTRRILDEAMEFVD